MIKTIDTRNITDIMLEAQNVIDGTTTYSDPLSFKDAADIFIAMAEAAPAVKPAQAAIKCKDCLDTGEQLGVYGRIKCSCKEPAQAVPVGRVLRWKGAPGLAPKTCIRGFDEYPKGYAQLGPWEEGENVYTAPPAIDAETKRMVLEQTNTKAAEPVQAVKTFWASENILKYSLRDNISCILTTTKCAANTVPLYTAPPAIDDETRHRLILVCEYLETVGLMFVSPRVISSQIRAILEADNEKIARDNGVINDYQ